MQNTLNHLKEKALEKGYVEFTINNLVYFLMDQKSIQWNPDDEESWKCQWFIEADNKNETGLLQLEEKTHYNGWCQYKTIEEALSRIEQMTQNKELKLVS